MVRPGGGPAFGGVAMGARARRGGGRLLWLLPAAALLWQGGLCLMEAWRTAPLSAHVRAAWRGEAVPPPEAAVLAAALPGRADGRAWSAYGQVAMAAAERSTGAAPRDRLLAVAEAATRQGLRLGPAQAATWARLAFIAVDRRAPDRAAAALVRSLQLAPNASHLAWPRLRLGLYLWDRLDAEARAGIAKDVARLAQAAPTRSLPYPRQALLRYAAALGRDGLAKALLAQADAGDAARWEQRR